jgi:hypothetical protein
MYTVWHVYKYKITFKLFINWTNDIFVAYCSFLRPLAARYNLCQDPVPGRGLTVEKHWAKGLRGSLFQVHHLGLEVQVKKNLNFLNLGPIYADVFLLDLKF